MRISFQLNTPSMPMILPLDYSPSRHIYLSSSNCNLCGSNGRRMFNKKPKWQVIWLLVSFVEWFLLWFNLEPRMTLEFRRKEVPILIVSELPVYCTVRWEARAKMQCNKVIYYLNTVAHHLFDPASQTYSQWMHFCSKCQDIDELPMLLSFICVTSKQILTYLEIYWSPANEIYHECLFRKLSSGSEMMSWKYLIAASHTYRTSNLAWWLRQLEFNFAVVDCWWKSKWHMIVQACNSVLHKYIAWSKMKEFANDFEPSTSINLSEWSMSHSGSDNLQMKHSVINALKRVWCYHIYDPQIERRTVERSIPICDQ